MKSKILTLVLNKNTCKTKILSKKNGNVTSLIVGLLLFMIVTIIVISNYRVSMLSEVLYNIDDMITASTLGAAVPNEDAFRKNEVNDCEQGQLVFQDALKWSSNKQNYYSTEWNTLLSEANSKFIGNGRYDAAQISAQTSDLKTKDYVKSFERIGNGQTSSANEFSKYIEKKTQNRTIKSNNDTLKNEINNLLDLMYTNISQSSLSAPKITNICNSNAGFTSDTIDKLSLKKSSTINKTFIGGFMTSDMEITRLQFYDVYRYTLAKRHVYASPYMQYKVNNVSGYTWDGNNIDGTPTTVPKITLANGTSTNAVKDMVNATKKESGNITSGITIAVEKWVGPEIGNEEKFKDLMVTLYPAMVVPGRIPSWMTGITESDYSMYILMRALWKEDCDAWNNRGTNPLVFWEDTGITVQTSWWDYVSGGKTYTNPYNKVYGFLWNNSSTSVITINNNTLVKDDLNRKLLPIEGVTTYMYTRGTSTVKGQYTSLANSGDTTSLSNKDKHTRVRLGDYNLDGSSDDTSTVGKIYEKRKLGYDSKNIETPVYMYNSGIYTEVAYRLAAFPYNSDNNRIFNLDAMLTVPVVQQRLVTLMKTDLTNTK